MLPIDCFIFKINTCFKHCVNAESGRTNPAFESQFFECIPLFSGCLQVMKIIIVLKSLLVDYILSFDEYIVDSPP